MASRAKCKAGSDDTTAAPDSVVTSVTFVTFGLVTIATFRRPPPDNPTRFRPGHGSIFSTF
jgi:hypothetical protein